MKCTSNIADHGPTFAPAQCIVEGEHITHQAANGSTWLDPSAIYYAGPQAPVDLATVAPPQPLNPEYVKLFTEEGLVIAKRADGTVVVGIDPAAPLPGYPMPESQPLTETEAREAAITSLAEGLDIPPELLDMCGTGHYMRPENRERDYDFFWYTPLNGGPCPICDDTTMIRQYGNFLPNPCRYVTHASGRVCLFPEPGWMFTPPDGTWHWRGGESNPLIADPARLQTEFAHMRLEDRELYEPDPDDLTRDQLAEYAHLPCSAVAETLDEWLYRMHGTTSSKHHAGAFLDFLAMRGYRVTAIPESSIDQLLGAPTE